jgi:hypothetical protein
VVPITNDTISEAAETFEVALTNPTGGAVVGTPGTATVTITDNDPAGAVQFSQAGYSVTEGGTATITVTRTGGTAGPVTVNFATSDGSATASADYTATSGTLTFAAGEASKAFTVATATDSLTEGSETVTLTLSGPTGGLTLHSPGTATLSLLDVPPPPPAVITFIGAASNPTDGASATGPTLSVTPPPGMQVGDLVVVFVQYRATDALLEVNNSGGQAWSNAKRIGNTDVTGKLFWCRFNGHWSASPSFSAVDLFGSPEGTEALSVVMHVARPSSTDKFWIAHFGPDRGTFDATGTTKTIAGHTTVKPGTISVAVWATADENSWDSLSGSGWSKTGISSQYRNTSGSRQSATFAYQIKTAAGATTDVSQDQATFGGDAGVTYIVSFAEIDLPTGGSGTPGPPVQTAQSSSAAATDEISATFDNPVTSEHSVVGFAHWENAVIGVWPVSVTDDQGNDYIVIQTTAHDYLDQIGITFFRANITNGPRTIRIRVSAVEAQWNGIMLLQIRGSIRLDSYAAVNWYAKNAFAPERMQTPTITPSANGAYVFGAATLIDGPDRASGWFDDQGPGWTERLEPTVDFAGGVPNMCAADRVQGTAAPLVYNPTADLGRLHILMIAAFTPVDAP